MKKFYFSFCKIPDVSHKGYWELLKKMGLGEGKFLEWMGLTTKDLMRQENFFS
jgi:hypothetical protein